MSSALSIYVLTSQAMAQTKRMDAVANNVANSSTPGYKRQEVDFKELVGGTPMRKSGKFVEDLGYKTVYTQGQLEKTGSPLDLALSGQGFFAVQGTNGSIQYTRAGEFTLDSDGDISTMDGRKLLDTNKAPINIPNDSKFVSVAKDGIVSNDQGQIGQIGLYQFPKGTSLLRQGENSFTVTDNTQPNPDISNLTVMQGYVEDSNVSPVMETVKMTDVSRAYESTTKLIGKLEDLQDEAVRNLAAVTQ